MTDSPTEPGPVDSIDAYIEGCPEAYRGRLQALRAAIREAAPEAEEAIRYRMPTFRLKGNLVHFALQARHIGFYPAPSAIEAFRDELAPYRTSKGAVQFPLDQPLPLDLVRRMVEFRVRENRG